MVNSNIKIAVGLSGGVDSSVAALLLKQQGYDVFAMFMQNWSDTNGTLHGECSWEEDRLAAEMVAKKIGIPFHFIDLSEDYRKRVVDYMFDEYSKGRTPNPDVLCNREIKFDAFLKEAEKLGADFVATGHYCIRRDEGGFHRIYAGSDGNKDQSYFLCQLDQEQLGKAMFPIGEIVKPEVRRIAHEAGLPSADKKDSQGICFVGKVDLPVFLQQKLKVHYGNIVEIPKSFFQGRSFGIALEDLSTPVGYIESDGKVVGTHQGAQYYTIGQRHGLDVGGHAEPLFVIATDIERNVIYVGEGADFPGLYRPALKILPEDVHWICPDERMSEGEDRDCLVRIRYRQPLQKATLHCRREGMYITFKEMQRGMTPGQFAVWYTESLEMQGSGVISR